jgi:hypothetical protein
MKIFALCSAAVSFLVSPSLGRAQNTGRIDCPRNDGYVYLYSSILTMDVRATLQCNEVVQITGLLRQLLQRAKRQGRHRLRPVGQHRVADGSGRQRPGGANVCAACSPYDARPREVHAPAPVAGAGFTLRNDTPVHVKLTKTISSATAHAGDVVEFEVLEQCAG